jgi:pyruvate/2-oxoglutarate dehydrogenase complex dihydrolipoamide dehydrogenase (E3) component
MPDLTCDVAVIGAGTAGLAAERAARAAGARTLLIDPRFDGTTCARVGCMPSKLLIAAAHAAHGAREADVFGVRAPDVSIDGAAVMARVRRLRDDFVASMLESLDDLPDGICVRAAARFDGPTTLRLDDGRRVDARAIVIATGSRPSVPKAFETVRDHVLTNESVFELPDLPRTLAVIGAGPLGLELAQAMARLGVAVTVFDETRAPAGLADEPEIAACLAEILGRDLTLRLGVKLRAAPDGDGARLDWSGDAGAGHARFDRILVAAGRPPSLDGLALDKAGLALDAHGTPVFDRDTLQCGSAPIFIAGDADHDRPVLHEASLEGAIAGRNAARFPNVTPGDRCVRFSIMFTDPPLAMIGAREADGIVGTASYADQGRARMMATDRGLARLYARRGDGQLTGATILAPGGEHLGHLLAWSIETGATASDLLSRPIYHPTYEEGLKSALRDICAAAGTVPPADRDEGNPSGG